VNFVLHLVLPSRYFSHLLSSFQGKVTKYYNFSDSSILARTAVYLLCLYLYYTIYYTIQLKYLWMKPLKVAKPRYKVELGTMV
jgi:hypothetical protein